jgi:galactokinase/mevalonate kinase-like predicted kinase
MKNAISVFFNSVVITFAVFLLSACHHYHALDSVKKAKMVSELISSLDECAVYKKQLTSSAMDDDSIDDVYQKAMSAGCVKKDI